MRILVIGGTGFVGQHVTRRLAQDGHAVTVLHRGETEADLPSDVARITGDRVDLDRLRRELPRRPDVVIDLILYTEAHAQTLVRAFEGETGRLVAISSGDVYRNYDGLRGVTDADPTPGPLAEDAPLRTTRYPYRGQGLEADYADDYDKILVEEAVRAADTPTTVLRLPKVYGPGDAQHHTWAYWKRMSDARPAILLAEAQATWPWSRGYVENVAAAIACAATDERAADRTYNVGEPTALTEAEWVRRLGAVVGWEGRVVTVPEDALPEALQVGFNWRYRMATDTRRIRTELGFAEPVSHAKALRRTIQWQRQHAPDPAPPLNYEAEDEVLRKRLA